MDELILPTLWLLLVAPQLLLSMCVCARARVGVFHGAFGVRGKYFPHLGRGDEGRLRVRSPVFYCREHLQYIKRRTSRRKDAQEARRGEGGKFFRATSRRAPLASLPPFPLLAPLALKPLLLFFPSGIGGPQARALPRAVHS